jgi:hypothetical protein
MRAHFHLRHWVLIVFQWACVSIAFAQEETPRPPKLRFLFLDESAGSYAIKVDTAYRQVSANPYEISAPFTPADFNAFDVYKHFPDSATGEAKPVKIARVTPPAKTTAALVVITPRPPAAPDIAPVYNVELIDSDPSSFPLRSIRIINKSPVAMAAQFSDSRVVTAPGEINLLQPVTDARHRTLFKIAIQIQQEEGGWQLIQDSITVLRPKERMVGILVYSPGGMRHMLTAAEIAEFGPPKPGCFWLTYSEVP